MVVFHPFVFLQFRSNSEQDLSQLRQAEKNHMLQI